MFDLTGAKLATITQAVAYRGIRERKGIPVRRGAAASVAAIQAFAVARGGLEVPIPAIWTAIRHADLRRPVADFIWRTMHDAIRCGSFWLKIQGKEGRATCSVCDELESIEHILFHCKAPGQSQVWASAAGLWKRKSDSWRPPSLLDIQTLGLGLHHDEAVRRRPGASRLWRILLSEAAHSIWRLRCERVVGHSDDPDWRHTAPQVAGAWEASLRARLRTDMESTRRRYGNLRRRAESVLQTWNGLVQDELALPADWTKLNRFLVGSRPTVRIDFPPG